MSSVSAWILSIAGIICISVLLELIMPEGYGAPWAPCGSQVPCGYRAFGSSSRVNIQVSAGT